MSQLVNNVFVTGHFQFLKYLHHAFKKYPLILRLVYVISDILGSQENKWRPWNDVLMSGASQSCSPWIEKQENSIS